MNLLMMEDYLPIPDELYVRNDIPVQNYVFTH